MAKSWPTAAPCFYSRKRPAATAKQKAAVASRSKAVATSRRPAAAAKRNQGAVRMRKEPRRSRILPTSRLAAALRQRGVVTSGPAAASKKKQVVTSGPAAASRKKGVVKITKEPNSKAVKVIEDMKATADALNVKTPPHWPAGAVPNVRAYCQLPEGWHCAKMVTGASGRGAGGNMRRCFIGPGGQLVWHKYDLEKKLGIKIETSENIERPHVLSPQASKLFPPNSILKRTDKQAKEPYINQRCDDVGGLLVSVALQTFRYDWHGTQCAYGLSDLRYDLKSGCLKLEAPEDGEPSALEAKQERSEAPAAAAKVVHKTATTVGTKRTNVSTAKSLTASASSSQAAVIKTRTTVGTKRRHESTAKSLTASASSSQAATTNETVTAETQASKRSKASAINEPVMAEAHALKRSKAPTAQPGRLSKIGLQHIREKVFLPLTTRAACGEKDEADIYALHGVGVSLRMDPTMLRVLPEILRKPPAARGSFGDMALQQFQTTLDRHLASLQSL